MADNMFGEVPVSFQPEMQGINQQQRMAQLLMQQALQQPQGQMISGRYVAPAITQQLAPLFAAYAGSKGMETAENKQLELAKAIRQGKAQTEQKIIESLNPDNPNYAQALNLIRTNEFGAGKEFLPQVVKEYIPETPTSVREFKYAMKNPEYAGFEMAKKRAGATQFNISDIMGRDIGQIKDLLTASQGRVQQGELSTNAANKIEGAIKTGNLNVGPGATVGQSLGQIGDALGLVNEKGQEKLVNSRATVQGLAQMWAASRAQAKGQGAMDQKESELYGKISSGNIDSLSLPELKYIVDQTKSQGNYFRQEHKRLLGELNKDPKLKTLVPFYDVGYMPSPVSTNTKTGGSNNVKYLGPATD